MAFLLGCFSSSPPEKVSAKGRAGQKYGKLVAMQDQPNQFQVNLCDAPCANPGCCLFTGICQCCGAYKHRSDALETLGNGIADYVCCQGYVPKCCCFDYPNMGRGSTCCLCLEACCCDTLSLSYSRIYVMEKKNLRPDPVDYQIIAFSNCMQMLACICHTAAMFIDSLRELAMIIDIIAEIVERTVSGCMGAQIQEELKHTKAGGAPKVYQAGGAPALAITDGKPEVIDRN